MGSSYAWLIFAQQEGDPDTDALQACSITGPSGAPDALLDNCRKPYDALRDLVYGQKGIITRRFQLRNGDGEVDAEGIISGEFNGFEPLDDIGEGNYGSTSIWYQEPTVGDHFGVWVEL